jgi:23S rRNA pseudouridine1911/1915/1917 synthase
VDLLIEEPGSIRILFEDDHLVAIDKPAGLLSHPNPGEDSGSILNVLRYMGYHFVGGEDPLRYGLIHRLDKDTTGILLLSKTQEAYDKTQNMFRDRLVEKCYVFPAFGPVRRMEFTRKDPLGRHPVRRNTRVIDPQGRDAETHFNLLEMFNSKYTLWEAHPKTGRTHQIRVHAQAAKLSILGDPHYSVGLATRDLKFKPERTLLHCSTLDILHPISGEELHVESTYPEDFQTMLTELRALKN